MKIIGFGHKQQTGKSTSSNYLVDAYGFVKDSYAKSLKQGIGKGVFGLTDAQMSDPILKETIDGYWGLTPRFIMQRAGTDAMRNTFSPDIWVRTLEKRIQNIPNASWAIEDVRFPDEANAIHNLGGIVIRLDRETPLKSDHSSETALDDYDRWDAIIDNNSSLENLYKQLNNIVHKHLGI